MNKLMNQLPEFMRTNKFYNQPYIDEFGNSDSTESKESLETIYGIKDEPVESTIQDANLISSENQLMKGWHYPILDLDFEASLIPSSTKGHYHLFLGKAMTDKQLDKLLSALVEAGIVQQGVLDNQWKKRKALFARVPWVKKGTQKMPDDVKNKKYEEYMANTSPVPAVVEPPKPETNSPSPTFDEFSAIVQISLAYINAGMEKDDAIVAAQKFFAEKKAKEQAASSAVVVDDKAPFW